ncbi:MAG: diguanylate cyclase [Clostridia bacterium]|nr:diguanylate cyclase [Clostridia bacterium]
MLIHDTILLAAASAAFREELRAILEENYYILEAANEQQLQLLLEQNRDTTAALIIDCKMTGANKKLTLMTLHENGITEALPVLSVVAEHSAHGKKVSLDLGASEVLSRPFHAPVVRNRVQNIVALFYNKRNLQTVIDEQAATIHDSYEMMMDSLSSIIEYRSVESGQHTMRIRRFTKILLEEVALACPEYKLDRASIQAIASASALHDIGKISIPDNILNKPDKLTDEEYALMKTHSVTGSQILEKFKISGNAGYLRYAYNICRYHHERYDGSGYPDGLSGEQIPICAQVVGLVDAYDALTTDRVYKKAIPYMEASNMIINGKCGAFSPKLLECFKHVRGSFETLARSYADGHSPKSDVISAALPAPEKAASDSLHEKISNYHALIHHFNAAAMEIDLDTDLFHLIYDPFLDFACVRNATSLSEAMEILARDLMHPDDSHLIAREFRRYMKSFFDKGLRKSSRHYRIKGSDGEYRTYEATSIRVAVDDPSAKKALFIWTRHHMPTEKTADFTYPGIGQKLDCRYDLLWTVENASAELYDMLGLDSASAPNGLLELITPKNRAHFVEYIAQQLNEGPQFELILPLTDSHKTSHFFLYKGYLLRRENGVEQLSGLLCPLDVVCNEYEKQMSLLSKYRTLVENTNDILVEWDLVENILSFSPNYQERYGDEAFFADAQQTLSMAVRIHPDDTENLYECLKQLQTGALPFTEVNIRFAEKRGGYVWNRVRLTVQRDENDCVCKILGVISDIDGEIRRSHQLQEKSERDSLTKLFNKEAGRNRISRYLTGESRKKAGAMIILDLDNFKNINDRFGHLFGDGLLTDVSAIVQGMFRESDVLVRIGGDEFLAFMTDVADKSIVSARCNELVKAIASLYGKQTEKIDLSCSVGVSMAPQDGADYTTLFQKADTALYQAKTKGKNCFRFYEDTLSMPNYSAVSKHIDSNERLSLADNSLIEYVFQRLYETNNMEATINSILELIGNQLNVSRVYVFENNETDTTCSNTFEWCNEGIVPQIENLQDIDYDYSLKNFINSFDEHGLMYCSDIRDLPDHIREIVEPQGIRALLLCAIRDKGVFKGYVGIDECNRPRLWTKEQISMVSFLAQLVSVFLLKTRAQTRSEETLNNLKNVLETLYAWVYVVDADSHRIKFFNSSVAALTPRVQKGSICYEVFAKRNSPCPECPIAYGKQGGSSVIPQTPFGFDVKAVSAPIRWEGNNDWLLTCIPLDKEIK